MQQVNQFQKQICQTQPAEPTSPGSMDHVKEQLNQSLEMSRKQRKKVMLDNPEFVIQQDIDDEKQNIVIQNKIRISLSQGLHLQELNKIKLGNKDEAHPIHSLFRWCMLILYKENPQNYQWQEFKKFVIDKDNGKDLEHRFGFISVVHMTQWDAERTQFLISLKPTILGHYKSHPKIAEQISKIFDIIEVVLKTFTASHKIKELLEQLIKEQDKVKECNEQISQLNHSISEIKTSLKSLE